jgi:hypothetical protein
MPYVSKAERAAASRMTWSKLIAHVRDVERCDEREARRQIGNAIADRALRVRWADEHWVWGISSPMEVPPPDEPPRDAAYWLDCRADDADPNRVLEPRRYDPELVDKHTAAQLDGKARFRKPIFSREQVLALWPQHGGTTADEPPARKFLEELLKTNRNLTFEAALNACHEKYPRLSERGFRARVWPEARKAAGLPETGKAGRPKSSRSKSSR